MQLIWGAAVTVRVDIFEFEIQFWFRTFALTWNIICEIVSVESTRSESLDPSKRQLPVLRSFW